MVNIVDSPSDAGTAFAVHYEQDRTANEVLASEGKQLNRSDYVEIYIIWPRFGELEKKE